MIGNFSLRETSNRRIAIISPGWRSMHRLILIVLTTAAGFLAAFLFAENSSSRSVANANSPTPVVVELFTSEGCSSCPPADLLLQKFDKQPIPGAQLIVLSEHVDYWNHIGWTDPYSSAAYSQRQSTYGNRLQLESVYTPQMVVDGSDEFVGSDSHEATKAFEKAAGNMKIPVRISSATLEGNVVKAHLETGSLPVQSRKADLVFVVALNHAESQVARGENSGRRLTHVAVVRTIIKAASLTDGQSFSQDVSAKIEHRADPSQLRVIAFLQESGQGRILGASVAQLSKQE
jgi:hypothetical protein